LFNTALLAIIVILGYNLYKSHSINGTESNNFPIVSNATPQQTLPASNVVSYTSNLDRVAPFSVFVNGSDNAFVKVKARNTNETIITLFIRAGDSVETKMPLGEYDLFYARGKKWFGYDHLFGSRTAFFKASNVLKFYQHGNTTHGTTITLDTRTLEGNNLRTNRVNRSQL